MKSFHPKKTLTTIIGGVVPGLPVVAVREILQAGQIVPVPDPAVGLCGVVNLYGRVIPVLDLRPRLGQNATSEFACVAVVDIRIAPGSHAQMGFLVNAIESVVSLPPDVSPTASYGACIDLPFARSIVRMPEPHQKTA